MCRRNGIDLLRYAQSEGWQVELRAHQWFRWHWWHPLCMLADTTYLCPTGGRCKVSLEQWNHYRYSDCWYRLVLHVWSLRDLGHISYQDGADLSDNVLAQSLHGPPPAVSHRTWYLLTFS